MDAKQLRQALQQANSQLDFYGFCRYMGFREDTADNHSLRMWLNFKKLCEAVADFDDGNLENLFRFGQYV